jgi:hypothetical protein
LAVTGNGSDEDATEQQRSENRRIDLAHVVWGATAHDFTMQDGYSDGYLHLHFDLEENRTMTIHPATPGVVRCQEYETPTQCAVLVDLLGDAVVWFALVPSENLAIELPAIDELSGDYAVLVNGWELQYAPVLDRRCDVDTRSFSDFQDRFGRDSTSIIDPGETRLTAVAC